MAMHTRLAESASSCRLLLFTQPPFAFSYRREDDCPAVKPNAFALNFNVASFRWSNSLSFVKRQCARQPRQQSFAQRLHVDQPALAAQSMRGQVGLLLFVGNLWQGVAVDAHHGLALPVGMGELRRS